MAIIFSVSVLEGTNNSGWVVCFFQSRNIMLGYILWETSVTDTINKRKMIRGQFQRWRNTAFQCGLFLPICEVLSPLMNLIQDLKKETLLRWSLYTRVTSAYFFVYFLKTWVYDCDSIGNQFDKISVAQGSVNIVHKLMLCKHCHFFVFCFETETYYIV